MRKSGLGSDGWLGVLVWVVWGRFFLDPLRQWWTALTIVMAIRSLSCFTVAEYGSWCLCTVMWARCCRIRLQVHSCTRSLMDEDACEPFLKKYSSTSICLGSYFRQVLDYSVCTRARTGLFLIHKDQLGLSMRASSESGDRLRWLCRCIILSCRSSSCDGDMRLRPPFPCGGSFALRPGASFGEVEFE
jgi:hypothetical protein